MEIFFGLFGGERHARTSATERSSKRTSATERNSKSNSMMPTKLRAAVDAVKTTNALGGEKARAHNSLRQFLEQRRIAMSKRKDVWDLGWNQSTPLPAGKGLPPPKQPQRRSVELTHAAEGAPAAPSSEHVSERISFSSEAASVVKSDMSDVSIRTSFSSFSTRSSTRLNSWLGRADRGNGHASGMEEQQDGRRNSWHERRHRFDRALGKAERKNRGESAIGWTGPRQATGKHAVGGGRAVFRAPPETDEGGHPRRWEEADDAEEGVRSQPEGGRVRKAFT